MQIDWFTVIAQIINFLILVWALNRFLMKPVLRAVDAREKLIASQLEDAARSNSEARNQQDEYARKNSEWQAKRTELTDSAMHEAAVLRQKLLSELRSEIDTRRESRLKQLDADFQSANQRMTERLSLAVEQIIDNALRQLSGPNIEELIIREFIDHLQKWNKAELLAMLPDAASSATLVSAFPVGEQLREYATVQMNKLFARAIDLSFETDGSILSGAQLRLPGRSIEWSFREYLRQSTEAVLNNRPNDHA